MAVFMLIFGSATPSGAGASSGFVCQKSMLGQGGSIGDSREGPSGLLPFCSPDDSNKKVISFVLLQMQISSKVVVFLFSKGYSLH